MKINVLFGLACIAVSLQAASPKDEVVSASKMLAGKDNYSWKETVKVPEDSQFKPGPSEGEIEKGGLIHFTASFNDNTSHTYLHGDKGALSGMDGGWQSLADAENEEGFGRFRAMRARAFKAPAEIAVELAGFAKDLKKDADVFSSDLSEEGAKSRMRFGGRDGGPAINNAKGSVKFWVKDGLLSKLEYTVIGTMDFNGNDFEIDRVTTVEIHKVGSTKIDVPEAAKKKLQ